MGGKKRNKNQTSISFPFELVENPQRWPALHHRVMTLPHSLRPPPLPKGGLWTHPSVSL